METIRGTPLTMSDGTTLVTEVVADEDSHLCLYVLLQDMIKAGDMVVGLDVEWGFKGCSASRSTSSEQLTKSPSELKSEQYRYKILEHHIAILTLCTKLGCIVVRLNPKSISPSLQRFLSIKDIIFVGVHIKEDLQRLSDAYGVVVRNAVELTKMAARIYDQPRFVAYSARDLAYKVVSTRMDQKPFTALWSNWFDHILSTEQIECTAVDAYAAYKIGKKLMESGSSSVKRLFI